MQHSDKFIEITQSAKQHIQEIDVCSVKSLLDQADPFYLVDVREESEWAQGHLPNAIHISKGVIERDIEKKIPDFHTKIVLYCGGGSRSALAAENLQKMGYTQVLSMAGGFRGWQAAGFECV